jgi:hypothetical protein
MKRITLSILTKNEEMLKSIFFITLYVLSSQESFFKLNIYCGPPGQGQKMFSQTPSALPCGQGCPPLAIPSPVISSTVHIKIKPPVTKILLTYLNGSNGYRHGDV